MQTMERRTKYTLLVQRDNKSTKERSSMNIYYKKHAKTSKESLHFQLIEEKIVLYKDEN